MPDVLLPCPAIRPQAALRSAEDEADAAAAVEAEQEVAAELAEFTVEPPAGGEAGAAEGEEGDDDEGGREDDEGPHGQLVKVSGAWVNEHRP